MTDLRLTWRGIDINDPHGRVVGLCVWCGKDAWTMGDTPFRPDIGALPLHLFCGAFMRDAYRAWRDGRAIDPADMPNMRRFTEALGQLSAGDAPAKEPPT